MLGGRINLSMKDLEAKNEENASAAEQITGAV